MWFVFLENCRKIFGYFFKGWVVHGFQESALWVSGKCPNSPQGSAWVPREFTVSSRKVPISPQAATTTKAKRG